MNITNRSNVDKYLNSLTTNNKDTKEVKVKTSAEYIKEILENTRFASEEAKQAYDSKINEKVKNGDKLTTSEMNYIRRTNPALYQKILRIQFKRDMLENKLKNCKSKKEVTIVSSEAFLSIDKKDPDKGLLVTAYSNVIQEFKKSSTYSKLPIEIKEEREKEKKTMDKNQRNELNILDFYHDMSIQINRSWLDVNA